MSEAAVRARAETVPDWTVAADGRSISRRFRFRDFDQAFDLVAEVAELARREDHHPDVAFGWGYATFTLSTHSIGGLHENDFIVAELIDGRSGASGSRPAEP